MAPSRNSAQADIAAGAVTVDGVSVTKPSVRVSPDQHLEIERLAEAYVSRAGAKLAAALDRFSLEPRGARCLDVGASTGGFTDCLLRRGAISVVAVDVGTDQLHDRIRADRRVTVREQTDIRSLAPDELGGAFDLVAVDVSFISLEQVLPALARFVDPRGDVVALVKPQFEAGREVMARHRGIVRDPGIWRRAVERVTSAAAGNGLSLRGATVSPITGASGNVEFVVWFQPTDGLPVPDRASGDESTNESMILAAIGEAGAV